MKKINLKEEIEKLNIDIKDFEKYIKTKVNTDVNTFLKSNFIFQLGFFIEYFYNYGFTLCPNKESDNSIYLQIYFNTKFMKAIQHEDFEEAFKYAILYCFKPF